MYHGPWGYGIFGRTFGLGARDYDIMCEIQNVGNKWVNLERIKQFSWFEFLNEKRHWKRFDLQKSSEVNHSTSSLLFWGGHNPVKSFH